MSQDHVPYARASTPSLERLTEILTEIEGEATAPGATQIGAAYVLGALGEACRARPGATTEDLARALLGLEMEKR